MDMYEEVISIMVDNALSGSYPTPRVTHDELLYAAMNSEEIEEAFNVLYDAIRDKRDELGENRYDPYLGKYM